MTFLERSKHWQGERLVHVVTDRVRLLTVKKNSGLPVRTTYKHLKEIYKQSWSSPSLTHDRCRCFRFAQITDFGTCKFAVSFYAFLCDTLRSQMQEVMRSVIFLFCRVSPFLKEVSSVIFGFKIRPNTSPFPET